MTTRTHIKEAAPKQGCCGEQTSHPETDRASVQTRQREKHIHKKPSAGKGACCCGGGSNDTETVEPQVAPVKPE